MRVISSVGQSYRLITGWSWVQVPDDPPKKNEAAASFFFYPNRRFGISSRTSVYIIKQADFGLPVCISSCVSMDSCGLMIYGAKHR